MHHDLKIIELEEKILFLEDNIQKLDAVVCKQYDLIDALTRRIKSLEEKTDMLQNELESPSATFIVDAASEKPPHY